MDESICVLGLGLMGRPITRVLLKGGCHVTGWNRSPLLPKLTEGIPLCTTLAEAAKADVCLLMLADSDAVDSVLGQLERYLVAGRLIIDMGSSDPSRSRSHAVRLTGKGIGWVDAPVSGGPEGAAQANLAIMAGGSTSDVTRGKPILDMLGHVMRVGEAGAGHTMKVINQLIVGLTTEAVAEALALAERVGLDPRLVQQALVGGFADSKILQVHGSRMIARSYVPGGKVKTQLKDLRLAQQLASQANIHLPHLESALAQYQTLATRGDGDLDTSAVHKLLVS